MRMNPVILTVSNPVILLSMLPSAHMDITFICISIVLHSHVVVIYVVYVSMRVTQLFIDDFYSINRDSH